MVSIPTCTAVENCAIPTDIVLVSSDGERFGSHTMNLGQFTGSFPTDIPPGENEEVPMKNLNAKTLAIFLRFVHHHCQPDLGKVDFDTLSQLAEAVEMYEVYSAMEFCKMHMSARVPNHAVDVFLYSVKHGYMDLADQGAENIVADRGLSRSILRVLVGLHEGLSSPWDRYSEYYRSQFEVYYNEPPPVMHPGGQESCKAWKRFRHNVSSEANRDTNVVGRFGQILDDNEYYIKDCRHCCIRARKWGERAWVDVTCFRKFSSFL